MHQVRLRWRVNQFCHRPEDLDRGFSSDSVQSFPVSDNFCSFFFFFLNGLPNG
jgi:hypothetical protein